MLSMYVLCKTHTSARHAAVLLPWVQPFTELAVGRYTNYSEIVTEPNNKDVLREKKKEINNKKTAQEENNIMFINRYTACIS